MEENFNIDNMEANEWLVEYKKANDEKTKEKLKRFIALAYMPLVKQVARTFARRSSDPIEDIIQVGSIGLLKALDLYSTNKNTSFKTYATYLITGEIRHYLRDKASMIRAPREIKELSYRINKIISELTQKYGATPTDEQLAEALQMPQKKIEEVIEIDRRTTTISIDQILTADSDNGQNTSIVDNIADEKENISREILENGIILKKAMEILLEDEKQIIQLGFYEGLNQREISEKLNMSQMQVSRKMKKALSKLFQYVTSHGVEYYE